MQRTILRLFVFSIPFLIFILADAVILPIDFLSFRCWEPLIVHSFNSFLPGPFYPHQILEKNEQGDLGHGTSYAQNRRNTWITDEFGQRYDKKNYPGPQFNIVLVGDSFIGGTGLDQSDMLNSVLARQLKKTVYPYYSGGQAFITEQRFCDYPPDLVILTFAETFLHGATKPTELPLAPNSYRAPKTSWREPLFIKLDHLSKLIPLNFLVSQLKRQLLHRHQAHRINGLCSVGKDGQMLFNLTELNQKPANRDILRPFVRYLKNFSDEIKKRGGHTLIMPLPMKSTVYYHNAGIQPSDITAVVSEMAEQEGLDVINPTPEFQAAADKGELIYWNDDTHWNPQGVNLAANLIEKKLKTLKIWNN